MAKTNLAVKDYERLQKRSVEDNKRFEIGMRFAILKMLKTAGDGKLERR